MANIFFLVLRRMRVPLILLIIVYSVATIGMTLIPGVTPEGETWRMSYFHAFYFVSYMGTTIGFGEIPYEFTDMQRSWVLMCIYTSVIAWLYGIGSVLRLVQDETFLRAVSRRVFQRNIKRLDSDFYIICGYGETGEMINRGLCNLGIQTVVIDQDAERISSLELGDFLIPPISLIADITNPSNLVDAGINNPHCCGVIALTNQDHTNLQAAVASKLANESVRVICRSEIEDEAKNMASFGTNLIINPYLIFAQRLKLLTSSQQLHQLQGWFINQYSDKQTHSLADQDETSAPKTGKWIICGYGRLGKAIHKAIEELVDDVTIIASDPIASRAPDGAIVGRGTEADTLLEAGIDSADVIVAATNDDANNLSIIMTAKQIKSDIFTVGRVSKETNQILFDRANCHYVMRRSLLVANEVLTSITRPLVTKFIKFSNSLTEDETAELANRIQSLSSHCEPVTWRMELNTDSSPELVNFINSGTNITIGKLCENPKIPNSRCIPLLLLRNGVSQVLPSADQLLMEGDDLLVCGPRGKVLLPQRLQHNTELLDSLINNNTKHIPLLRWLARRKAKTD